MKVWNISFERLDIKNCFLILNCLTNNNCKFIYLIKLHFSLCGCGALIKNRTPGGSVLPPAPIPKPNHWASRTQTDIAHWFYLLIRSTLWSFYLIFMPAAISISVIELSLCGQATQLTTDYWLVLDEVLVFWTSLWFWLVSLGARPPVRYVRTCQKRFCAWLALGPPDKHPEVYESDGRRSKDTGRGTSRGKKGCGHKVPPQGHGIGIKIAS